MNSIKKIKNNEKGFTLQDLVAAIFIITIFAGIIGSLMVSAYKMNARIDLTAQMTTYAVQILEDIDKIAYEEVTPELTNNYYDKFSIPGGFKIDIEVSNYGEEEGLEDIIKVVKLGISYTFDDETEEFNVTRLKIKEL